MTDVYAPLYEAKMLSFFDHRAADSVRGSGSRRQTVPSYLSDAEKDDPQLKVVSLYWVSEFEVEQTISDVVTSEWLLGARVGIGWEPAGGDGLDLKVAVVPMGKRGG